MNIIGIGGSLRKGSFNRKALNTAKQFFPEDVSFEIVEIGNLPLYNPDFDETPPQEAIAFREKVKKADAILFSMAEYNYSVSSVLKNAIEWGSRPYGKGVMQGKPVAIMGVSSGMLGTGRGQYHLRQICVQVDMHPLNRPEVMIPNGQDQFDEAGNLVNDHTKEKIKELVEALVIWTKQFQTL